MKRNYRISGISFLIVAFTFCMYGQNIVYNQNFNGLSSGQYSQNQVKSALNVTFCKGADEGRFFIENFSGKGKVLKVKYPKGAVKTGNSGIHTKVPFDIPGNYEALYFSYKLYIPSDFEFRAGAKIPGLSHNPDNGKKNTSLRLMWRKNGLVEYYVHYRTKPTWPGWRASINWSLIDPYEEPGNSPQPDQVKLKKGQWNDIEMYIKLNTPGQADGIMRGWLNGQLAIDITDHRD